MGTLEKRKRLEVAKSVRGKKKAKKGVPRPVQDVRVPEIRERCCNGWG